MSEYRKQVETIEYLNRYYIDTDRSAIGSFMKDSYRPRSPRLFPLSSRPVSVGAGKRAPTEFAPYSAHTRSREQIGSYRSAVQERQSRALERAADADVLGASLDIGAMNFFSDAWRRKSLVVITATLDWEQRSRVRRTCASRSIRFWVLEKMYCFDGTRVYIRFAIHKLSDQ